MTSLPDVDAAHLRTMPLPTHENGGDKDARGSVLAIGGSAVTPGAILLSGMAALRAGAGRLGMATCHTSAALLGMAVPEAMVMALPETESGEIAPEAARILMTRATRSDAVLIGPGMIDDRLGCALSVALLNDVQGPAYVLDVGAMRGLLEHRPVLRARGGRTVITPHAGEMASLLGVSREEVLADRLGAARQAASDLQVVVAMKGSSTYIVTPEGKAWLCRHGNIGLATSGSGDVLAGIIAGLLARGASPVQATVWAVYIHGEAGVQLGRTCGPVGYLARELIDLVPQILASLSINVRQP